MKRILFAAVVAGSAAITLTGCEKCTECTVYNKYELVDSSLENIETCGNKKDIDAAEQRAADYATAIQGTYECIEQ